MPPPYINISKYYHIIHIVNKDFFVLVFTPPVQLDTTPNVTFLIQASFFSFKKKTSYHNRIGHCLRSSGLFY